MPAKKSAAPKKGTQKKTKSKRRSGSPSSRSAASRKAQPSRSARASQERREGGKPRARRKTAERETASRKLQAISGGKSSIGLDGGPPVLRQDRCIQCEQDLREAPRALFVEEELGRVFCSENCIVAYFAPEIDRMERAYFNYLSDYDLTPDERRDLSHLRWTTLESPGEVWREKTLSGDHRFTLIAEYESDERPVWSVCVTLFLRGEPSFLFLAFVTRDTALVDRYRRGERVEWTRGGGRKDHQREEAEAMAGEEKEIEGVAEILYEGEEGPQSLEELDAVDAQLQQMMEQPLIDGLAEPWTEDETYRAQMGQFRRDDDIPSEDFPDYEVCLEDTLQTPDEVWTMNPAKAARSGKKGATLFHFLRHFSDRSMWYVIVARETDEEDQLEILDAFPTRDPDLIDRYRRGAQEIGPESDAPSSSRMIH